MKIPKSQLKQIIKEELTSVLAESVAGVIAGGPPYAPHPKTGKLLWTPDEFYKAYPPTRNTSPPTPRAPVYGSIEPKYDTPFGIPKSEFRKGAIKRAISNTARRAALPFSLALSAYDIYTGLRDPKTHIGATFLGGGLDEEAAFNKWKEQNPDNPNANISYDDYKAARAEMGVGVLSGDPNSPDSLTLPTLTKPPGTKI
tara:strand:+ start:883 stop:1479 length:597 start_codon:yes stop_codon:yes gene_type:complete